MSLNEFLGESKVFADRGVLSLHYTPKKLVFREKEIGNIEKALAPALKGEHGRNLFIYGRTGTGKTSCTHYVIDEVKDIPEHQDEDIIRELQDIQLAIQGAEQDSERPPANVRKARIRSGRPLREDNQLDRGGQQDPGGRARRNRHGEGPRRPSLHAYQDKLPT